MKNRSSSCYNSETTLIRVMTVDKSRGHPLKVTPAAHAEDTPYISIFPSTRAQWQLCLATCCVQCIKEVSNICALESLFYYFRHSRTAAEAEEELHKNCNLAPGGEIIIFGAAPDSSSSSGVGLNSSSSSWWWILETGSHGLYLFT